MIYSLVVTNVYLFIMAVVLAILEIQIEGEHGWAKNLPTWRPKNNSWLTRLYSRMMSGKELTGYHLSMFGFVFLILHLPYAFGLSLTLDNWLKTMSIFFLFSALWDFLWFVLNPYYPLKKFKAEYLSFHHKQWLLGVPVDYYFALIFSFLILLPIVLTGGLADVLVWWGINVSLFAVLTLAVIIYSLYVLKIDNWSTQAK